MTDNQTERRVILTRAASVEARRQSAHQRQDWQEVAAAENELLELWRRYGDLGDDAALNLAKKQNCGRKWPRIGWQVS